MKLAERQPADGDAAQGRRAEMQLADSPSRCQEPIQLQTGQLQPIQVQRGQLQPG